MARRKAIGGDPRGGDPSEQGDDRKDRIIEAAAYVFMIDGFAAATIDRVAEILGSTKGFIYYQYKSKGDLFLAVHEHALSRNLESLKPIATGTGSAPARLKDLVVRHVKLIVDRPHHQRVSALGVEMHSAGSTTPEQRQMLNHIGRMRKEFEGLFVSVIEEGIKAGTFRPGEPKRMIRPLLGALNWMALWYNPPGNETDEKKAALAADMVDFILYGVGARENGAAPEVTAEPIPDKRKPQRKAGSRTGGKAGTRQPA